MRRWFLFVVLLLLIAKTAVAALSFPALTGRVVDDAGILSEPTRVELTQKLEAYEQATNNQVVVVTLKSLQGDSIEDYGYQLGRFWGIGQKGKDNGALLIVAPVERKVRIEVGYGLEATLTDAMSSNIVQTIILPDFRAGQMERGVIDGTAAILATLKGDAPPALQRQERPSQYSHNNDLSAMLIFIVVFVLCIFSAIRNAGRRGVGGGFIGGGFGGGGFGGGGGFSGGGGSFGGGGASGGW